MDPLGVGNTAKYTYMYVIGKVKYNSQGREQYELVEIQKITWSGIWNSYRYDDSALHSYSFPLGEMLDHIRCYII